MKICIGAFVFLFILHRVVTKCFFKIGVLFCNTIGTAVFCQVLVRKTITGLT